MDKKELKLWFRVLTTPDCWIRLGKTNKEWDAELREHLKNPVFEKNEYSPDLIIKLNGIRVWVSNYPYSYGDKHCESDKPRKLPSRRTVFMLFDAVQKYKSELNNG